MRRQRSKAALTALTGAARIMARADVTALRALNASRRLAGGFYRQAATLDELGAIGTAFYEHHWRNSREDLFGWERAWFDARLPKNPARILLGGSGDGREAEALATLGHHISAFDLAAGAVARCDDRLAAIDGGFCVRCGYESLARDVLEKRPSTLTTSTYDAVLMGWGSFTHVLDPNAQRRVLRALSTLCPEGPILMSFWCERRPGAPKPMRGRAFEVGQTLGRGLRGLRGIAGQPERSLVFITGVGAGHIFGREHIDGLAQSIGRRAIWEGDPDGFPHVTMVVD